MRRISAMVPLVLVASGLAACSDDGADEARQAAERLAAALSEAASLTPRPSPSPSASSSAPASGTASTAPADPLAGIALTARAEPALSEQYREIVAGMDRIVPRVDVAEVSQEEARATATLGWSWPVVASAQPWTYETTVPLRRVDGQWRIEWSPAVVEPSLAAGDVLDAVTQPADRGDITGAGGEVLVTERPVIRVGIDKIKVKADQAAASARQLAAAVGIDAAAFAAAVAAAGPRAFVEAITYREGEVPARVEQALDDVAGAQGVGADLPLAPTRTFAAPILGRVGPVTAEMVAKKPKIYRSGDLAGLSGLQGRYDDQLRGRPGRVVQVVPAAAEELARTVYEQQSTAGEALSLTLDRRLQVLAEKVLAPIAPASALVALRPSTGEVLAAANGAGTDGRNDATFGRFAPGSTFKIVSALALLRSGLSSSASLTCPATTVVNGKSFKNYSDYPAASVGRIPFTEAVAQSCNTAFITARDRLQDKDLAAAAASLGFGVDHDLGFPAYFGAVPDPAGETEAAADLIGQGKILASPMAMATVIASVQAGRTVVPRLVEKVTSPVPAAAAPLTAAEVKELRAMLRAVVTSGSGRGLADVPGGPVLAKTGTAEYADPDRPGATATHAWMVAAQDDLAVAVFVRSGESGSRTAGPLVEAFLRGARP